MSDIDVNNSEQIMSRLREQCAQDLVRVTIHGNQEMVEEDISYESMIEALSNGTVVENYPEHLRGSCCLVCGQDFAGRFLHICCTTSLEVVIILTVYEPQPPKWPTPYKREVKK